MLLDMSRKTRKTHIQKTHTRTHTQNTEVSKKVYGTKAGLCSIQLFSCLDKKSFEVLKSAVFETRFLWFSNLLL